MSAYVVCAEGARVRTETGLTLPDYRSRARGNWIYGQGNTLIFRRFTKSGQGTKRCSDGKRVKVY